MEIGPPSLENDGEKWNKSVIVLRMGTVSGCWCCPAEISRSVISKFCDIVDNAGLNCPSSGIFNRTDLPQHSEPNRSSPATDWLIPSRRARLYPRSINDTLAANVLLHEIVGKMVHVTIPMSCTRTFELYQLYPTRNRVNQLHPKSRDCNGDERPNDSQPGLAGRGTNVFEATAMVYL